MHICVSGDPRSGKIAYGLCALHGHSRLNSVLLVLAAAEKRTTFQELFLHAGRFPDKVLAASDLFSDPCATQECTFQFILLHPPVVHPLPVERLKRPLHDEVLTRFMELMPAIIWMSVYELRQSLERTVKLRHGRTRHACAEGVQTQAASQRDTTSAVTQTEQA